MSHVASYRLCSRVLCPECRYVIPHIHGQLKHNLDGRRQKGTEVQIGHLVHYSVKLVCFKWIVVHYVGQKLKV